ncbi:lytic murein transglycosylase [Ramlibacter monticola]|uniref:Lytic murein transglycosylase n=1 Tax=Ramlibacter monticola TaxID=1926872 RepID=A0A936Z0U2_9BURK|nr:lytic murein transglycosylase [Ramlibacter monticola]MBL0392844.1 lytic murein transglycosylase [Ramlibacter monticola]
MCAALACSALPAASQEAGSPLSACVAALRKDLPAHRDVSAQTFETYTRDAQDLRPVIENATRAQPEFQIPIWDYLARRVDAQRIEEGRALLQLEAAALEGIARTHRVEPAVAVAVFGIETDYGHVRGRYPVVDATLSRACLNLGSRERKQHFFDALWLLQEGVVRQEDFNGSWAGAFGMTQFMPGTFRQHMADGDGSGSSDIVHSVPDALATTARYLRSMGWADGQRWGVEVRVPEALAQAGAAQSEHGCLASAAPSGKCRSAQAWSDAGVTRIDGSPLLQPDPAAGHVDGSTPAALLMPAGAPGPAWLVTPNYQAIWRYNRADTYALAIGLLSDALRGLPPPQAAWPTDDPGLSRVQFRELQQLLLDRGHCEMRVDGSEGPRTGAAIRAEEERLGWPPTGRAGSKLLAALREARTEAAACPVAGR